MCEYRFLFVLCQNVMYYCTELSAVFDWICTLQVFIIIIIIIISIITIIYHRVRLTCLCTRQRPQAYRSTRKDLIVGDTENTQIPQNYVQFSPVS